MGKPRFMSRLEFDGTMISFSHTEEPETSQFSAARTAKRVLHRTGKNLAWEVAASASPSTLLGP